jgi:hypothetical protein
LETDAKAGRASRACAAGIRGAVGDSPVRIRAADRCCIDTVADCRLYLNSSSPLRPLSAPTEPLLLAIAGNGTALQLSIAPRFRCFSERPWRKWGLSRRRFFSEYTRRGLRRPRLAFAHPGKLARALVELKEPHKLLDPHSCRGHDADTFRRFGELPLWALSNFASTSLYCRSELIGEAKVQPVATLDPATPAARASRLIRVEDHRGFKRILLALATAETPAPRYVQAVAEVLARSRRRSPIRGRVAFRGIYPLRPVTAGT